MRIYGVASSRNDFVIWRALIPYMSTEFTATQVAIQVVIQVVIQVASSTCEGMNEQKVKGCTRAKASAV